MSETSDGPASPTNQNSLLLETLFHWQAFVRRHTFAHRFTVLVRVLLAIAFIPSGLKKVAGQPFTTISVETPIGSFFDAFFQAQGFYVFVGLAQVLAALLLLVPRTALLGALLFLPIISNIVVITWTLQFRGTWLVTLAMLGAVVYLLLWDAHRLLPLVVREERLSATIRSIPRPSSTMPLRAAALLTLCFGSSGLVAGLVLMTGPSALVGVWLIVTGAVLFPLFLAASWEFLAAARQRDRPSSAPTPSAGGVSPHPR